MSGDNSGEFEHGVLAGKVESMEGSIKDLRNDVGDLFEGQNDIKLQMQRVADATERQAEQTEIFIKQCAACRQEQDDLSTRVTNIESEIDTKAIKRKAGTDNNGQAAVKARDEKIVELQKELKKAQENSAVSWVQTAFKNSMIKLFEAAIWVTLVGGILWVAGAFDV